MRLLHFHLCNLDLNQIVKMQPKGNSLFLYSIMSFMTEEHSGILLFVKQIEHCSYGNCQHG